jgi:hypothetical protein
MLEKIVTPPALKPTGCMPSRPAMQSANGGGGTWLPTYVLRTDIDAFCLGVFRAVVNVGVFRATISLYVLGEQSNTPTLLAASLASRMGTQLVG